MTGTLLILVIAVPAAAGVLAWALGRVRGVKEILSLVTTAGTLGVAALLFTRRAQFTLPWAGFGMDFSLRLYHFSAFTVLATAFFAFLIALYAVSFMRSRPRAGEFYGYLLLSLAAVNGAALADNLVLMLFFWEGLLLTLFGFIVIGRPGAFRTALKAFVIVGLSDLALIAGVALTGHLAGTFTMSAISLPVTSGLAGLAFVLMLIGALGKAGAMPFHSWIPDAALDAPLPFMAFFPAALEKLLGIYFLARIALDLFQLVPESWLSMVMMVVGAVTILLAVMMALVQKDYKRLLSYHAISQVGYMILGIGTCLPAGIVGGLFHMVNNALYKSGLFLTGGAVEHRTGTTDLARLGGLGRFMPVTFICFLVTAVSISGVPPFNGFFSKELVYDAALERGIAFYLAALIGSFFTAASFLKLGHAAFLGPVRPENRTAREAPLPMLVPMVVLAAVCVLFGVDNYLPINALIAPVLPAARTAGHHFAGFPTNGVLVLATVLVLALAFLQQLWGARRTGSGLHAIDHIHHAPVLGTVYAWAERRYFDPYDLGRWVVRAVARAGWWVDQAVDWVYNRGAVVTATVLSRGIRRAHAGNYTWYVIWSLVGIAVIVFLALR